MTRKAIFIAATGQNVGKTTVCLGILAGLQKRYQTLGFLKPVGQKHVLVDENLTVDRDVVLFKHFFQFKTDFSMMSPVVIPPGYTRDFLDNTICSQQSLNKIRDSFQSIHSQADFTVVEGTGHVAVGSIAEINNAKIASLLGLEMIMIVSGGLGSALDQLSLNLTLCQQYGIKVIGVIANSVLEKKRRMIMDYLPKALKTWNVPLVGCIPYSKLLSNPNMQDFVNLLCTPLLSGIENRFKHFRTTKIVAESLESYLKEREADELIITPSSREDIILQTLQDFATPSLPETPYCTGMILTGSHSPSAWMLKKIHNSPIPILYTPLTSFETMKKISSFLGDLRIEDTSKIKKAIDLVEHNIDFNAIE